MTNSFLPQLWEVQQIKVFCGQVSFLLVLQSLELHKPRIWWGGCEWAICYKDEYAGYFQNTSLFFLVSEI